MYVAILTNEVIESHKMLYMKVYVKIMIANTPSKLNKLDLTI